MSARVVVPRWVQLVLLPLALLALWALARASGKVLLIFIVAAVIALILNPAVAFLQRSRLPRGLAVLAVYLAFFLTLAAIGFLLANPISSQVKSFTHNLPTLAGEANKTIANLQGELDRQGIHLHLVKQGKTALQTVQDKVAKSAGKLASSFGGLVTEAAGAIFDIVLVFVLCSSTASASARSCAGRCRTATARARTTTRRSCSERCPATSAVSSFSAS
jgi:predicted PurR-regulated permease PerM